MDGIIFADMPWTLSTENTNKNLQEIIIKAWPKADRQYWRLYALGADAYAISAYLNNPSTRLFSHRGNTGNIYMDHNQRIYRELIWAQFRRGIPRIIN
jgi:outer membrane PBP1 activator LpoA protein